MKEEYTLVMDRTEEGADSPDRIAFDFEASTLPQLLDKMTMFLRASGYSYVKELQAVTEDSEVISTNTNDADLTEFIKALFIDVEGLSPSTATNIVLK